MLINNLRLRPFGGKMYSLEFAFMQRYSKNMTIYFLLFCYIQLRIDFYNFVKP